MIVRLVQQAATATATVPLAHGIDGARTVGQVRALTGWDEAMLADATDLAGQRWITDALDRVTLDVGGRRPGVDGVRTLTVGDRNSLLLGVVAATYDPILRWQITCGCGEVLDAEVDIAELSSFRPDPGTDAEWSRRPAGLRLPTGGDLEAISVAADVDAAWRELDRQCQGDRPDPGSSTRDDLLSRADPLAELTLRPVCWSCGAEAAVAVDPAIELAARLTNPVDLLHEVHVLARTYGWTEDEILGLPRPRRRAHLLLIADEGR